MSSPNVYNCSTVALGTTLRETKLLFAFVVPLMTKTLPKSKLVLKFTLILCQSCRNWLTRLALWPNYNGVPGTLLVIHLDLLPPRGHAQAMGARDDGNGGRGPMLASNMRMGAHNNGNGGGGPTCDRRLLQRQ